MAEVSLLKWFSDECHWTLLMQCYAKALEKWGQMTHTIEKYGDICNFSVILPFMILKYVGTLAPTAKIIGDIPDFNVLNVPKTQPWHNPADDKSVLVQIMAFCHQVTSHYLSQC